jgi:hypothetical protein
MSLEEGRCTKKRGERHDMKVTSQLLSIDSASIMLWTVIDVLRSPQAAVLLFQKGAPKFRLCYVKSSHESQAIRDPP